MSGLPVSRDNDNTFNIPKIPIIFVPGVMGTRLSFPGAIDWDPDHIAFPGWLGLDAVSKANILKASAPARVLQLPVPASKALPVPGFIELTAAEGARGWGEPVSSFYGSFLRFMSGVTIGPFVLQRFPPFETPVHAVGYDFRQSNAKSGAEIAKRINKILSDENAEEVIIVSHSMGGLATRSALLQDAALSAKVRGIIHVMQPAAGAAVFYRRLFTGNIIPEDDPGFGGFSPINIILGTTPTDFATIICGLRGPTELMPTPQYTDSKTAKWINHSLGPLLPPPPPLGVSADWSPYRSLAHPPGLVDSTKNDLFVVNEMINRVNEAEAFHDTLTTPHGLFKHPNTWAIFSTGLPTDVAFFQFPSGSMDFARSRRPQGDGTVPASSASILFPGQAHTLADICNGDPRQFVVHGVAHSAGMADPGIQALVEGIVRKVLGLLCFPPSTPGSATATEDTLGEIAKEIEESIEEGLRDSKLGSG
jgi:hypothetical protein